jgi:hypothetical protein
MSVSFRYDRMKASSSALIVAASVVHMPGGNPAVRDRHDLVVIAVHDHSGHSNLLQIRCEVGLGERDDAVIVGLGPPA